MLSKHFYIIFQNGWPLRNRLFIIAFISEVDFKDFKWQFYREIFVLWNLPNKQKLVNGEGGGVKNPQNLVKVVYECPLMAMSTFLLKLLYDDKVGTPLLSRFTMFSLISKFWLNSDLAINLKKNRSFSLTRFGSCELMNNFFQFLTASSSIKNANHQFTLEIRN